MDMNDDIVTLPKTGLKTKPYNIGMEKEGLKKYDYNIDMNKRNLKKLTKKQLIKLLLKQQAQKPRNSIKQMVNEHEDKNSTTRTIQRYIQANSTTDNWKLRKRKTETCSTQECQTNG